MSDIGFEIDGKTYEIIMPSAFDLDEAEIFYSHTGFPIEDIWLENLGFNEMRKRKGFLGALAHIAYRRGNTQLTDDEIKNTIGKQNRIELFGSLLGALSVDDPESEDPKAQAGEPTSSSPTLSETGSRPNGTPEAASSSGDSSMRSSDEPDVPLETIGTTASAGVPVSGHLRPVA